MDFASPFAYWNADESVGAEVDDQDLQQDLGQNILREEAAGSAVAACAVAPGPAAGAVSNHLVAAGSDLSAPSDRPRSSSSSRAAGLFSRLFGHGGGSNINNNNNIPAPAASSPAVPPLPPAPSSVSNLPRRKYRAEVDTNVASIKFSTLAEDAAALFAGDPTFCQNCKVALSNTSKLKEFLTKEEIVAAQKRKSSTEVPGGPAPAPVPASADGVAVPASAAAPPAAASAAAPSAPSAVPALEAGQQYWPCEFCSHINIVELQPEEIPTTENRDYILEPAPVSSSSYSSSSSSSSAVEPDVIFVIDISASMCVTTEVQGKFELKGKPQDLSAFNIPLAADERDFVHPRRQQQVTYVSRLQCVQASIDKQIEEWKVHHPNKRVGLITFNNDVTIYADLNAAGGAGGEVVVTGDKLSNQQELLTLGSQHTLSQPISVTAAALTEKLFSLSETGQTALGPALVIAIAMAGASGRTGSRVVLCTDGKANRGLGSIDGLKTEEEKEAAEGWYRSIGMMARQAGVSVSVVSITGAECSLEDLGQVAAESGGEVQRVDPLQLTNNFSSILAKPVIATNVQATFHLHAVLQFRNMDDLAPFASSPSLSVSSSSSSSTSSLSSSSTAGHCLIRDIGNVTADSEMSFEYTVNRRVASRFTSLTSVPFQVQIRYTKPSGMKCLRVISANRPLTHSRDEAERNARVDVLGSHVNQYVAREAERGNYGIARSHALMNMKMMKRAANAGGQEQQEVFSRWADATVGFDRSLQQQQVRMEAVASSPSCAVASGAGSGDEGFVGKMMAKSKARSTRSDADYAEIAKFKSSNSRAYANKVPAPSSASPSSSSASSSSAAAGGSLAVPAAPAPAPPVSSLALGRKNVHPSS